MTRTRPARHLRSVLGRSGGSGWVHDLKEGAAYRAAPFFFCARVGCTWLSLRCADVAERVLPRLLPTWEVRRRSCALLAEREPPRGFLATPPVLSTAAGQNPTSGRLSHRRDAAPFPARRSAGPPGPAAMGSSEARSASAARSPFALLPRRSHAPRAGSPSGAGVAAAEGAAPAARRAAAPIPVLRRSKKRARRGRAAAPSARLGPVRGHSPSSGRSFFRLLLGGLLLADAGCILFCRRLSASLIGLSPGDDDMSACFCSSRLLDLFAGQPVDDLIVGIATVRPR